jgi:hypothetical protein
METAGRFFILSFLIIVFTCAAALAVPTHVTVYAYDPANGNTGVDTTTLVVK